MSTPRTLGNRLLLRILLLGCIVGFLVGYAVEQTLLQYGHSLPYDHAGPLFGVVIGLITGYVSYLITRRVLLRYIHSLHDNLGELREIRPGLRDELSLDDEASALFDQIDYEVSILAEDRSKLRSLVEEAKETLEECSLPNANDYKQYERQVDERLDELKTMKRQAEQLQDWFESTAKPIFHGEMDSVSFDGLDEFDDLIRFHSNLRNRLETAREEIRGLKQVIQPWKKGPERLKEAIRSANDILEEAAELFREFPHEELPEKAESLRQETESWDELARQIEQGVQRLNEVSGGVDDTLDELRRTAEEMDPPEQLWTNVKDGCQRADNRIDRLNETMDESWLEKVETHLDQLETQASWLTRTTRDVKETLKEERKQVDTLNDLLDTLESVVGQTDSD